MPFLPGQIFRYVAALIGTLTLCVPVSNAAQQIYSHGEPTGYEQLMLEMINRARAEPLQQAQDLGIDLNQGLAAGTISATPKPPLAFHPLLIQAARKHSDWMLQTNTFSHTGVNGSSPTIRAGWEGFNRGVSENIASDGTTGTLNKTSSTISMHDALFRSAGHRVNTMGERNSVIGLCMMEGRFNNYNAFMATQNFADTGDGNDEGQFLLGIVYQDANQNGRYDPGEGIPNVEVRPASGSYYAVTSQSGGYAIPFVPAAAGATEVVNLPFPVNGSSWDAAEPYDRAFREQKRSEAPDTVVNVAFKSSSPAFSFVEPVPLQVPRRINYSLRGTDGWFYSRSMVAGDNMKFDIELNTFVPTPTPTSTFKMTVAGQAVDVERWGTGPKGVVFFSHSGDLAAELRATYVRQFASLLGQEYSMFLWKYPTTVSPFNRVSTAIQKWRTTKSAGAAFLLSDRVAFPGIATSVVSQIRQATGLQDLCLVGNSLGAGVLLSDHASLSFDSGVRFVLVSPTEAFMPATLSGRLARTILVSDPANDFYLGRAQDITFLRDNTNGDLPPGYVPTPNQGHLIIGEKAPLDYVFALVDQAFASAPEPAILLAGDLSFGEVRVGTTGQRTLTITNTGNASLIISRITFPQGFSGNWTGGAILPSASREVMVTFRPTAAQSYDGSLSVVSNAGAVAATTACAGSGQPVPDTIPPVLSVTQSATVASSPGPFMIFSGTVIEVGSKPTIEFSADGGVTWSPATIPSSSVSSPYTWTANVTLGPGSNTFQFRAKDQANNVSAVVSRTVTYTVPLPVVALPAAGAKLTSAPAVFSGTVPSAGGMPGVEFSSNGGATWAAASVSGSKAPYAWSASLPLSPGANTVLIRTVDAMGQRGQPVSRSVTYLRPSSGALQLAALGNGTFTAGLAGKNLNLNMPYKVTATAAAGMIFKEWLKNGVSVSRNATLNFTMEEGLKLEPVFIANPFPAVAGTFNGLAGNGTETDMGAFFVGNGFATLTTTATGTFTGSLRLEGQALPLTGKFDGYGETTLLLKRVGKSPVAVALKLDLNAPGKVSGSVTPAGGTALAFTALPGVFTGVKPNIHPLNLARYTIILPAPDAALGHGYATMVVDVKGLSKIVGKLADGTTFTTSARMVDSGDGNWVVPVHIPFYTGFGGMLLGEVVVPKAEPAATADVVGSLGWLRPANAKATLFPAGFLKTLAPQGERYRLMSGLSLLTGSATPGNFTLTIDPGLAALPAPLTQPGTWPATNLPVLTKPLPTGLSFTFTPSTGVFKGAFLRPVGLTKVSTPYEGVILANPLVLPGASAPVHGTGFFTTPTASGTVLLEP